MALKVFVDHAQRRLWKHRIGVTVAGSDWVPNNVYDRATGYVKGENIFIDPVYNTLMLEPFCLNELWSTNTTGGYARWGLTDFGLSTGDGWYYKSDKQASQNRMANPTPMAAPAILTTTLAKNQGVFVSFFCFNEGDKELIVFECGWSDSGSGEDGVSLRFFAGGRVQVWKDNVLRGIEHINFTGSRNNANEYVSLVLMPYRRRELLIYSPTSGGGFSFLFEEISETEADPEITTATAFWFKSLIAPDVELAPLRFPTTGYGISPEIVFADVPETGRIVEDVWELAHPLYPTGNDAIIYGDLSFHGAGGDCKVDDVKFIEIDSDVTEFVPNGIKNKCRLRFDLVGNGYSTPFLYGIHRAFKAEYAETADAEVEITDFVIGIPELQVPDSAYGVGLSLEFERLDELAEIAPKITKIRNRPVRVELDDVTLLDGYLLDLEVSGDSNDRRLRCVVRDIFSQAERIQLTSRLPFDGLPLSKSDINQASVFGFLCKYLGIPDERIKLDDADFAVPYIPGERAGDFGVLAENGDTIQRCFEKLIELFAKSWGYGQKPDPEGGEPIIFFKDPVFFSDTPIKELYCDNDEVPVEEGEDVEDPLRGRESAYGNPTTKAEDIAANECRITGQNPRNNLGMQSVKRDENSQDPTVAPEDRDENWNGGPLVVGVIDGRFTTQEATDRAAEFGFSLLTQANYVTEWPCMMIFQNDPKVPAWRFDLAKLNGYDYEENRITSFTVAFEDEAESGHGDEEEPILTRSAVYTGGTLYNQGGVGMRQIIENARAKARNRTLQGAHSQKVLGAIVATVSHV